MLRPILAVVLSAIVAVPASGAVITVGPAGDFKTIADAVDAANALAGADTISIAPGTYLNDFAHITTSMTITGAAVLQATVAPPNNKAIMLIDGFNAQVTVNGLTFTGAAIDAGQGGNGAGIRDQQTGPNAALTVLNSVFRNNQDGILQGANNFGEVVTIAGSRFENNGRTGQEHGIYVNAAESLSVAGSYFCGEVGGGHLLKSRALATTVTGSTFFDGAIDPANPGCGAGTSSYAIDLSNGGVGTLTGNSITQGAGSPNLFMIDYGGEGLKYTDNSLSLTGNTLVNTKPGGVALLDAPCVPVQLSSNNFTGVAPPSTCIADGSPPPPPSAVNAPGSSLFWLGLAVLAGGLLGRNVKLA